MFLLLWRPTPPKKVSCWRLRSFSQLCFRVGVYTPPEKCVSHRTLMQLVLSSQETEQYAIPALLSQIISYKIQAHKTATGSISWSTGICQLQKYSTRVRILWKPFAKNLCVKYPLLSKDEKRLMSTCLRENMKDLCVSTAPSPKIFPSPQQQHSQKISTSFP